MADIFAGTEPPAWLQRMTAQEPGMLGSIFGELVGGLADAGETAIDRATAKQAKGIDTNWIKELPGSIKPGLAEARLNTQNPLWKIQLQQSQLNMAEQGLRIQNEQSLIDSRKSKLRMQEHDQEVLPRWLQDHPTWESRQDAEPPELYTSEAVRMYRDVQLGDAGNIKHKAIVEGIGAFAKSVAELQKIDPVAAAPFAAQIGKVPTPQVQAQLGTAMAQAQSKAVESRKPQVTSVDLGDGKTVPVVWNPKTGHFEKLVDKQAEMLDRAKEKAMEEQRKTKIDVAKDRVKSLFKDLNALENQDPKRQKTLRAQYDKAQGELDVLLGGRQSTPQGDPLGLFSGQGNSVSGRNTVLGGHPLPQDNPPAGPITTVQ